MNEKFKIGDLVTFKAQPNPGQMTVVDIKTKFLGFPHASEDNPLIIARYWDDNKKDFEFKNFYFVELELVKN